ncbi:MAG TPA: class I SAM-dependent methyltransferase, partial [Solirubrobacteraceae bacterium]|nr:class I SAM-dependent methyltransferase [Solirubrobacteraceae bacterium]
MSDDVWSEVDRYVADHLLGDDPVLDAALADSAAAGLPAIAVSPPQGKLLHLLARVHGARRILEVGTLGGYSTIWLARALGEDGRVVTLELDPGYAATARANVERAGLAGLIEI